MENDFLKYLQGLGPTHEIKITSSGTSWLQFGHLDSVNKVGYKLHIAAGLDQAPFTIIKVAEYLYSMRIPFKTVNSLDMVRLLNSGHLGLTQVGKIVTAYFISKDSFFEHTLKIRTLLAGHVGPTSPTDKKVPDSDCLSYRYGTLIGPGQDNERILSNAIPENVSDPFEKERQTTNLFSRIKERYLFLEVMRRKGSGAIYRAIDLENKKKSVLKEAIKFGDRDLNGRDAWDFLDRQYDILRQLEQTDLVPKSEMLEIIGDSKFIALDFLEGFHELREILPVTLEETLDICYQVEVLLKKIHDLGYVWNDLSSSNILIRDGVCKFVDFEHATRNHELPPSKTWPYAKKSEGPSLPSVDFFALSVLALELVGDIIIEKKEDYLPPLDERPRAVLKTSSSVHQLVLSYCKTYNLSFDDFFVDRFQGTK